MVGNAVERLRNDEFNVKFDQYDREIDGQLYRIWTKKLSVSKLGDRKVIIADKVTDAEGDENPVKYLVTNQIDPDRSYHSILRLPLADREVLR